MAVTAKWFGVPIKNQYDGTAVTDWNSNAIKTSLHTSAYAPAQDTDDFFNDCTNELPTAGGYTAGGVALGTLTAAYDTASNEIRLDAGDAQWTAATFTTRIAVVYNSTPGTAATNPLVSYVDFGGDETVSAGTFTITWDSTGVAKITAA